MQGWCQREAEGATASQNLNSGGIVPVNGDNVPNHNATKQGLYCSQRKPYKEF